jgi:hypothetical protein
MTASYFLDKLASCSIKDYIRQGMKIQTFSAFIHSSYSRKTSRQGTGRGSRAERLAKDNKGG